MAEQVQNQTVNVILSNQRPRKSAFVAFLLTFLFGPLGMFYTTVLGAIIMIIVSIIVAVLTLGLGPLITWPICIIWACLAASK